MKRPYYIFMRTRDMNKLILTTKDIRPATKDWTRKVMESACSAAGIPLFTSKDLRHAYAFYALRLGTAVDDVAN